MSEEQNTSHSPGGFPGSTGDTLEHSLEEMASQAPFRHKDEPITHTPVPEAGACPEISTWLRLAGGEAPEEERRSLLAHAALCTSCLYRLRECQAVFSHDFTAEEIRELDSLTTATPAWRHRFAVELAHTHRRFSHALFQWLIWGTGPIAVAAAVLVAVLWWQHANAPEALLAEAYTQNRPFELRIPGGGFGPVRPSAHLRGDETGMEAVQLLTARAHIERELERTPTNAHWLQLEARAEVLEEHYDTAIDNLDRLVAAGPVTASLLADDGMAYFLRGVATGSENDRATALDTLQRAAELAPNDPVVLFNEAVVMEDRGLLINAAATWNRFLNCERDPAWRAEGQQRLNALQEKLNRLKTHQSRMEQHLASPAAMRALAEHASALASIDEEFSTTFLPPLLNAAYPLPVDRSRGSPCADRCLAARSLLHALATSLEHNHQDPWLTRFLPLDDKFTVSFAMAAHALGQAIDADTRGNYAGAPKLALAAQKLFHKQGNTAGEARALVERAFALQRAFTFAACHKLLTGYGEIFAQFPWIGDQAAAVDAGCDVDPGTATDSSPLKATAFEQARKHHYVLLELRARNALGGTAIESGDTESAWHFNVETLRQFYSGDYPSFRAGTTLGGLASMEDSTPRVHLDLVLHREAYSMLALTENHALRAEEKIHLLRSALRAGALEEAQHLLADESVDSVRAGSPGANSNRAEAAISMAEFYLDRHELPQSSRLLEQAQQWMAGEDNPILLRSYAVARGELELAQGHPETAESVLRASILEEEQQAQGAGKQNIIFARQNRDLYAALAGVWLAQGRPGDEILALWERYRLRILGEPVRACANNRLDCLAPTLRRALRKIAAADGRAQLIGQIILRDRLLLYRANARGVNWQQIALSETDLISAASALERVTNSPFTSPASFDQASRRLGGFLLSNMRPPAPDTLLLLEPDPLLGNLPWPAVDGADGPIGLHFALQETPSILLRTSTGSKPGERGGSLLTIGASVGAGVGARLPEVVNEARMIAGTTTNSRLLLANQATEPQVEAHLSTASIIHFAGHAVQHDGETRLLLAPTNGNSHRPYLDRGSFLRIPPRAAQLVVFSACSTGKREAGWDHGMSDIVDTLASLGVPQVVATRWQIDSASAVPMMSAFYRSLAHGESVPQALRVARLALFHTPQYNHPYYWAAYYASGTGTTNLERIFHGKSW